MLIFEFVGLFIVPYLDQGRSSEFSRYPKLDKAWLRSSDLTIMKPLFLRRYVYLVGNIQETMTSEPKANVGRWCLRVPIMLSIIEFPLHIMTMNLSPSIPPK